jgi:hypothetical protein
MTLDSIDKKLLSYCKQIVKDNVVFEIESVRYRSVWTQEIRARRYYW